MRARQSAPERNSRSSCPLTWRSLSRPRVAITCWRTVADAPALDDLQINPPARLLLAEIHDSPVVRTYLHDRQQKSDQNQRKRGTTRLHKTATDIT
jgi:hypothetical protein